MGEGWGIVHLHILLRYFTEDGQRLAGTNESLIWAKALITHLKETFIPEYPGKHRYYLTSSLIFRGFQNKLQSCFRGESESGGHYKALQKSRGKWSDPTAHTDPEERTADLFGGSEGNREALAAWDAGSQVVSVCPLKAHLNCSSMRETGLPHRAYVVLTQAIYKRNEADNRAHEVGSEDPCCWQGCCCRRALRNSPVSSCRGEKHGCHFTGGLFHPVLSLGSCPWVQASPSYANNTSRSLDSAGVHKCAQENLTKGQNHSVLWTNSNLSWKPNVSFLNQILLKQKYECGM